MGMVIVVALVLALAVLAVVVRPWQLPDVADDALPAVAH
jgi:DHA1 family bicyclomycin/chloramphenicol resistance-like MFS transporter